METEQILGSSDETLQRALNKLVYCSNAKRIKSLVIHHDEKNKWSIHVGFFPDASDQIKVTELAAAYDYDGK